MLCDCLHRCLHRHNRARKLQSDRRSLPRGAFNLHAATGLAHKTVDHRQPQPTAAAGLFGGEKRLEDLSFHLLRHPASLVGNFQHHHILLTPIAARDPLIPGTDFNRARLPVHGVTGIHHQIDNGVLQLADINPRGPGGRLGFNLQRQRSRKRVAHQFAQIFQQRFQLHRMGMQRLFARKGQQPLGKERPALGGF